MKKFVVLLAVLCLAFAVALGFLAQTPMPLTGDSAETQEPAAETAVPVEVETLDYEALYALHDPAEVVRIVDGKDVAWG